MALVSKSFHKEDQELITSSDLVASAHAILGGIELDVASSQVANQYVEAESFFTPLDDGLNSMEWEGSVYLFPPSGTYFFDKKQDKWRKTRSYAKQMVSGHAIWWRKLYKNWLNRSIKQGIYFSNCPDMIRYQQEIFDFPICILRTAPELIKNSSKGIQKHRTCTSMVIYLPPQDQVSTAIQNFVELYSEKGRVIC